MFLQPQPSGSREPAESIISSAPTLVGESFSFPLAYSYPPFFTPQPAHLTRQAQLSKWSSLIQSYCAHHRIFRLQLTAATLGGPLFHNAALGRRLAERDARDVLDWMASEAGDRRAEWIGGGGRERGHSIECWVWWRRPEEWASLLEGWVVEETGQRGQVLTLYELIEGEDTKDREFHGMNMEALQKALGILVRRGKAQVFGTEGQEGVKFF